MFLFLSSTLFHSFFMMPQSELCPIFLLSCLFLILRIFSTPCLLLSLSLSLFLSSPQSSVSSYAQPHPITLILLSPPCCLHFLFPLHAPVPASRILQVLDHVGIYLLIAGTYTPFLLIGLHHHAQVILLLLNIVPSPYPHFVK